MSILIADWPPDISPAVIEGGCASGEMLVDVVCPKSCEFDDMHDSWSSESILSRLTIRDGGYMMGGRRRMMVERPADEDALEQGYYVGSVKSGVEVL
jgi:hypothetical protein